MRYIFYKAPNLFGAFLFIAYLLVFNDGLLLGQELPRTLEVNANPLYDNDLLSKEFHAGRREVLRNLMADSSIAVFFSSSVKTRSNDVDYEFHQDPNFYYFTGLNEPGAVLLVFKNEIQIDGVTGNEILFLQDRNPKTERWTGKLLGTYGAKNVLGLQTGNNPPSAALR